jgi:hypothetical protein
VRRAITRVFFLADFVLAMEPSATKVRALALGAVGRVISEN